METPHLEHPVLNCAWILIQLRFSVDVYIYIVAFCCGDPTLRTSQMLTCIIPTFDGIYFVATVDRSAGSLLYPKAPKQGFGCSQKSRSIYMYICIYFFFFYFMYISNKGINISLKWSLYNRHLGKSAEMCTYEICKHCQAKAAKASWIASDLIEKRNMRAEFMMR